MPSAKQVKQVSPSAKRCVSPMTFAIDEQSCLG
jgi:hypothetical protein